jgi:hypothetical protein
MDNCTVRLVGTTNGYYCAWHVLYHIPMLPNIVCYRPAPMFSRADIVTSFAWDHTIDYGQCQPVEYLAYIYYATTAVNIGIDWFCALLPIPLLWHTALDMRAKLSVGFLLSLGVLASIAACVRQHYTSALSASKHDVRDLGNLVIWGCKQLTSYRAAHHAFQANSLSQMLKLA